MLELPCLTVGTRRAQQDRREEPAMGSKNKGGREARKPKQDQNKKPRGQTPVPGSVPFAADSAKRATKK